MRRTALAIGRAALRFLTWTTRFLVESAFLVAVMIAGLLLLPADIPVTALLLLLLLALVLLLAVLEVFRRRKARRDG